VAATGLSGGLALFWRKDVTVAVQSMSKSHMDVVLSCDLVPMREWRLTGFYGEPRRELIKEEQLIFIELFKSSIELVVVVFWRLQ
jgi:hypothetical protein